MILLKAVLKYSTACDSNLISHDDVPPGKYSRVALAEEEQCEDLLLFMRILTHLTSKDFLDFGNSGECGSLEICQLASYPGQTLFLI